MQKPDDKDLPILPCDTTTSVPAAVLFVIDGENDNDNTLAKFTLNGAKFAGDPVLSISDNDGQLIGVATDIVNGTGDKKSTAEFNITTSAALRLEVGDQLMLSYHLKDAALATAGSEVTMSVDVAGSFSDSVVIARSKDGLSDITLKPQAAGKVQIDVTNENKKFATNGEPPAYLKDIPAASICYLNLNTTSGDNDEFIAQCNGYSEFLFNTKAADNSAGCPGDLCINEATLKITGGQFQASMGANAVYINAHGDENNLPFNDPAVAVDIDDVATSTIDTDTFEATWNFTDEQFGKLGAEAAAAASGGTVLHDNEMPIIMTVNGTLPINVIEDPPMASLTIDFLQGNDDTHDWAMQDFGPIESECLLITRNGMVCNVFNVPAVGAQDQANIRITNESSKEAKFTMTLYGMDGSVLGGPTVLEMDNATTELSAPFPYPNKYLQPGHTVRLSSAHVEEIFGTWTGRARLEITSTLPKIEIMSLLRYANHPELLTNMSLGASGASCTQ